MHFQEEDNMIPICLYKLGGWLSILQFVAMNGCESICTSFLFGNMQNRNVILSLNISYL